MIQIRTKLVVGIVGMAIAGLTSVSCSSSKGAATDGAAGSGGGVDNGGSGGAGGSAGAGGRACTASTTSTADADGLIADFENADGGSNLGGIKGGILAYNGPIVGGPGSPTYTVSGGTLNIVDSTAATSAPQYVGVVVYFDSCIDASAFTGVQFDISGSFSGCTMQYATGDVAHQDETVVAPTFATGPAGSYPPQSTISVGQLTSAPQTIMEPFAGYTIAGGPNPPVDTSKLILTLWQFTVPAGVPGDGGTPGCTASIAIDNVKFYR